MSRSNAPINENLLDDEPSEFNDTLEAVDYFCSQGKKILDETSSS